MAKANSFAKHAAPYLREALKKAARTYKHGKRPRKNILTKLRAQRKVINEKILNEKLRGRGI